MPAIAGEGAGLKGHGGTPFGEGFEVSPCRPSQASGVPAARPSAAPTSRPRRVISVDRCSLMDEAPSLGVRRSSSYREAAAGDTRKREHVKLLPFAAVLVPDRKDPVNG